MTLPTMHDLIVVGAGPAGSMAAYHAAAAGLDVVVMDRAPIGRVKPCAGGLSTKALARLPFSVSEVVESHTNRVKIGLRYATSTALSAQGVICGFVDRKAFDCLLLKHAQRVGAHFRKIDKITSIAIEPGAVHLVLNERETVRARYLIAADGANSQVRRLTMPYGRFSRGFAVEGRVARANLSFAPEMEFSFGCLKYGYGWVFPKGDHVNVGLYTCRDLVRLGKDLLRDYAFKTLGTNAVKDIVGFPLGFGGNSYKQTQERLLFAGDAAGLAEPLLGEGIYNALRSGELSGLAVARALCEGRSAKKAYNAALRPIRRDLRRSTLVSNVFYSTLEGFGFKILKNPVVGAGLIKGYAAGKTFHQITDRFALMPWQKPLWSARIQELHNASLSSRRSD